MDYKSKKSEKSKMRFLGNNADFNIKKASFGTIFLLRAKGRKISIQTVVPRIKGSRISLY
jgi:hypothetical protein